MTEEEREHERELEQLDREVRLTKHPSKLPDKCNNPVLDEQLKQIGDSCYGKVIVAGTTGFAAGGIYGLATTAMGLNTPIAAGTPASMGGGHIEKMASLKGLPPTKALQHRLHDMTNGTWKSAKNFAYISTLFAGSKCAIESVRDKDDIYNSAMAGCATGAWVTRSAGPQACAVGCVGFAAFSTAVDLYVHQDKYWQTTSVRDGPASLSKSA